MTVNGTVTSGAVVTLNRWPVRAFRSPVTSDCQRRGLVRQPAGRDGLHAHREQERAERQRQPDDHGRRDDHHDHPSPDQPSRDGHLARRQRQRRHRKRSRVARNSLSPVSATTDATGQVTFTNVPTGSGYTLSATKNGQTTTLHESVLHCLPDRQCVDRAAGGHDQGQRPELGRTDSGRREREHHGRP